MSISKHEKTASKKKSTCRKISPLARRLTPEELHKLRQDMAESHEYALAELARRRAEKAKL